MKLLEEMKIIEEVNITNFLGKQKQGEELRTHMGDKEDRSVLKNEPDEELEEGGTMEPSEELLNQMTQIDNNIMEGALGAYVGDSRDPVLEGAYKNLQNAYMEMAEALNLNY